MDAIVAVYSDWGIGARGTQPVVLHADRAHFREKTRGAAVIVGRKTMEDFPGGRPLKGRHNIVVTRQNITIEGAELAHTRAEALALAGPDAAVIGGASVYSLLLPDCDRVRVTKVFAAPPADSFFPNLDNHPDWRRESESEIFEENGFRFQFIDYVKK